MLTFCGQMKKRTYGQGKNYILFLFPPPPPPPPTHTQSLPMQEHKTSLSLDGLVNTHPGLEMIQDIGYAQKMRIWVK